MHVLEPGRDGLSVCAADGGTVRTEVMTDLVGDLAQGDRVLVHAGVAIAKLT